MNNSLSNNNSIYYKTGEIIKQAFKKKFNNLDEEYEYYRKLKQNITRQVKSSKYKSIKNKKLELINKIFKNLNQKYDFYKKKNKNSQNLSKDILVNNKEMKSPKRKLNNFDIKKDSETKRIKEKKDNRKDFETKTISEKKSNRKKSKLSNKSLLEEYNSKSKKSNNYLNNKIEGMTNKKIIALSYKKNKNTYDKHFDNSSKLNSRYQIENKNYKTKKIDNIKDITPNKNKFNYIQSKNTTFSKNNSSTHLDKDNIKNILFFPLIKQKG